MELNIIPRVQGFIGSALGVFFVWLAIAQARADGTIWVVPCVAGPLVLPISFALLVLPTNKLFRPIEVDGKLLYPMGASTQTRLGRLLLVAGIVAAGLFYLVLRFAF